MTSNRRTAASSRARTRAIRRRMAETGESYSRAARVVDALAARPTAAEPQQSPPPPQDQVALAGEVLRYIDAWCGGDLGRFTHAMPPAEQYDQLARLGRLLAQRCRTFTDPLLNSAPASTGAEELVRVLLDTVRKLKEALTAAGPAIAQDDGISRVLELRKACQQVLVSESICWQRAASRVQTAVLRSWGARVTELPERGEAGQEAVPREYAWVIYRLDTPHHSRAEGQAEEPGPARAQAEEALRALAACAEGRSVKGGQVLR